MCQCAGENEAHVPTKGSVVTQQDRTAISLQAGPAALLPLYIAYFKARRST